MGDLFEFFVFDDERHLGFDTWRGIRLLTPAEVNLGLPVGGARWYKLQYRDDPIIMRGLANLDPMNMECLLLKGDVQNYVAQRRSHPELHLIMALFMTDQVPTANFAVASNKEQVMIFTANPLTNQNYLNWGRALALRQPSLYMQRYIGLVYGTNSAKFLPEHRPEISSRPPSSDRRASGSDIVFG